MAGIENDERLIQTLEHTKKIYTEGVFTQFNLDNLSSRDASNLRSTLKSITRYNPRAEAWMEKDTEAITTAIDAHSQFTKDWLGNSHS